MKEIMRQVARASRRLSMVVFIQSLAQAWFVAFAVLVIALVIPKLWPLPLDAERWSIIGVVVAAGLGIVWAMTVMLLRWPSKIVAATEIDQRLQLRERLSSAMQLSDQDSQTAIGQALISDAERTARRLDIRQAFPLRLANPSYWGLVPIALTAATFFFPNALPPARMANVPTSEALTQIKNSTRDLMELVRQQRENAEENGLDESAEFFKQLQSKVEDLQKSNKTDARKILVDINQLKKAMQQRRDELGSAESLKKNFANLKSLDHGPAEKMSDAIKDGDFGEASQELEKMMDDLEMGTLSKDQQSQLANQMQQMASALERAAAEHEQAKEALEKQIAVAEQAGDTQKVADLRQKLAEKQLQDEEVEELTAMAAEMVEAKESLEKGDRSAAKKALDKMNARIEKMEAEAKQLQELDKLIEGADECKKCANGQTQGGTGKGGEQSRGNQGIGEGTGAGEQPEEEKETRHIESQVRTDTQAGEVIYGGKAGGGNRKGVTREEIQQSILAADDGPANALENIAIPKKQRQHTREYFESLRSR